MEFDGPTGADELAAAIQRSARRDGLSDFAAAMSNADASLRDNLLAAIGSGPPVTLVIDEIGRLDDSAAELLADVSHAFRHPGRLLLAGRSLPSALAGSRASWSSAKVRWPSTRTKQLPPSARPAGPNRRWSSN